MAVAVVIVKINLFYEEQETTFVPLHQQVHSNAKYTGNGFLPCKGYVPTPVWCHYPRYSAFLQRPNNIGDGEQGDLKAPPTE